jgi:hypothetical protein
MAQSFLVLGASFPEFLRSLAMHQDDMTGSISCFLEEDGAIGAKRDRRLGLIVFNIIL